MLQLTLWSFPSLAAIVLSIRAFHRVRRAAPTPGWLALSTLCGCVALWASGQLVGTLTTDLGLKILASKAQYPAIALLPVAWFIFALSYVRRVSVFRIHGLTLLLALPAITVVLAWTNELHGLVWRDIQLKPAAGFVGMTVSYGVWFKFHAFYSYALIAAGTLILIYELSGSPHHRRALAGVVVVPAVVAGSNLAHLTSHGPLFIDLTPLGFAVGALILYEMLLNTPSLEVSPQLHRELLQKLADPVVILGADGRRIMEMNGAARTMLGRPAVYPPDKADPGPLDAQWLLSAFDAEGACREAVINGRSYDVRTTRLESGNRRGRLLTALVFRDVTERLKAEAELRRMKQEMEHLAHTDVLTELPNRRYFMARLREEAARQTADDSALSVLLVDLDYFKHVNDTYGHEAGDEVLVTVGRLIRNSIRGGDVAARIGGEEFAVLLPRTPPDQARAVGERIRSTIEAHVVERYSDGFFRITASAGLATIRAGDGFDLMKLADEALYRAKASGRNAVCS